MMPLPNISATHKSVAFTEEERKMSNELDLLRARLFGTGTQEKTSEQKRKENISQWLQMFLNALPGTWEIQEDEGDKSDRIFLQGYLVHRNTGKQYYFTATDYFRVILWVRNQPKSPDESCFYLVLWESEDSDRGDMVLLPKAGFDSMKLLELRNILGV